MGNQREIPNEIAAKIIFLSDRTCCVCRLRGRPIQIHHIDEKHLNHSPDNLAVLCLDCHRDTQIRGGFDRKLDAHQIILYRNDWHERIKRRRQEDNDPIEQIQTHPVVLTKNGQTHRRSSALLDYINTLPAQRHVVYKQAQKGWDTGITSTMVNASYGLLHNLETYLVGLGSFYPDGHFGQSGATKYFQEVIKSRFDWHGKQLEPDGPGSRGTMIGPMVSASIVSDIEDMIVDMVRSLTQDEDDFNFTAWLESWSHAA